MPSLEREMNEQFEGTAAQVNERIVAIGAEAVARTAFLEWPGGDAPDETKKAMSVLLASRARKLARLTGADASERQRLAQLAKSTFADHYSELVAQHGGAEGQA